jgi:hypothetical protein
MEILPEKVGALVGEMQPADSRLKAYAFLNGQNRGSVEIHRGLDRFVDFTQGFRRETAGPTGQFRAVQRGHLMAHGKALPRQTGSPTCKLNDGRCASSQR